VSEEKPTKAVARVDARQAYRATLEKYSDKLAVFGVRPEAYIEAALMAAVKLPDLFKCTPESVALALRQCAQVGLEIGRTAHLVPYGQTATFIPDYKGLIELTLSTHKVVSIRTRCVYEGETFEYFETAGGPEIRHVPRLSGAGGRILGAYAIADMRLGRYKVEWMTFEEIEVIRAKSRSWAKGALPDWYARKTVVRRLCKTLPANARLQQALRHDDAEGEVPDGVMEPVAGQEIETPRGGYALPSDYDHALERRRYEPGEVTVTEVAEPTDEERARVQARAAAAASMADPYEEAA
jgi:phage RecT family recombinase